MMLALLHFGKTGRHSGLFRAAEEVMDLRYYRHSEVPHSLNQLSWLDNVMFSNWLSRNQFSVKGRLHEDSCENEDGCFT